MTGYGLEQGLLSKRQVTNIIEDGFEQYDLEGKRILCIIPDHTRTAPLDMMFEILYKLFANHVRIMDFLVALGTHPPMSKKAIYQRVGITSEERKRNYPKARFFNHQWKNPDQLRQIGMISQDEVAEISKGLMRQPVRVTINKIIFDYDLILIIGPVFPHEVVGFSGGNKYLFPGISGQEMIDMFHWLGALITNPVIIGTKNTPVRDVVDRAVSFVPIERLCLSMVVSNNGLAGLYIGSPETSWRAAADQSEKLHIYYKDQPFSKVLSGAPRMYDDLWTAGKCMYKLEPVVADDGELIIYAPHIQQVSVVHGAMIEKIGYHVRDYFVKQMDRFGNVPGGVMAHSTHVKGIGTFENGIEKPRIRVTLATQIPKEDCEKVNLGYRDPRTIHVEKWQHRENEGILYVPKAGEMLYRLKNDPFKM